MAEIYQFKVRGTATYSDQIFINSLWWKTRNKADSPLASADMALLASTLGGRWNTNMASFLNAGWLCQRYEVLEVAGYTEGEPVVPMERGPLSLTYTRGRLYLPSPAHVGVTVGDPLPSTVSGVCQLFTERHGRRGRGRLKLGPFTESDSSGDQMTTQKETAINNGIALMIADVTIAGLQDVVQCCVFSPTTLYEQTEPGDPWEAAIPVQQGLASLTWGVQRSRKYGTGISG